MNTLCVFTDTCVGMFCMQNVGLGPKEVFLTLALRCLEPVHEDMKSTGALVSVLVITYLKMTLKEVINRPEAKLLPPLPISG